MGPPCSRQRTYRFHQPDSKALRDHHLLPDLLFRLCWRLQRYHRGQQSRLQFGKVRRNRRMGPRHWARDTQFPRTPQPVAVRRRRLGPSLFKLDVLAGNVTIPAVVYDLECLGILGARSEGSGGRAAERVHSVVLCALSRCGRIT